MISQRARGLATLHATAQAVVSLIIFWCWAGLHFELRASAVQPDYARYAQYSLLVVLAHYLDLALSNRKDVNLLYLDMAVNSRISLRQCANVSLVLMAYLVAVKDSMISRAFLFSWIPLLYSALFITNKYLPRLLASAAFYTARRHRILFVGSSKHTDRLKIWADRRALYGFETIGIVPTDGEVPDDSCLRMLGKPEDLAKVLLRERPSHLILTEFSTQSNEGRKIADLCERNGVRLLIVNDLSDYLGRPVAVVEHDEFCLMGLRREPLESPFNRVVKRALDIIIAIPVVFIVIPITSVFVWLGQRIQSPGPVFHRQTRSGINNRDFTIIKFRTMHVHDGSQDQQATRGDARVYPLGRFLRRFSLDELPQFINVLNGEMSAVGPRPHLPAHNDWFMEEVNHYNVRTFIKPGITGLAQVRGHRGETKCKDQINARIDMDLHYVENWSLTLDLMIVLRTMRHMVLPPKSAY
ncbi:exopolysaccharide biosynthesis polyprenyl glycosylphosphotransferase [Phragmitibacter flavus]|nr:exopolysaccharide biosynthesis polyprenyl glycosylphosphotransferase [Phragmitibacter flavus]